jgi:hypothetical protein
MNGSGILAMAVLYFAASNVGLCETESPLDHGPADSSFDAGIIISPDVYPATLKGEMLPEVISNDGHKCLATTLYGGVGHTNEVAVYIHSPKKKDIKIDFKTVYGDISKIQWINENLVLLRIWWGRHWGTDYIFNADTSKIVYSEGVEDPR